MRDKLSLTYLELFNCSVDDSYTVIPPGQTAIEANGSHTIKVHEGVTMSYLSEIISLKPL